jgi:hypothetical protein
MRITGAPPNRSLPAGAISRTKAKAISRPLSRSTGTRKCLLARPTWTDWVGPRVRLSQEARPWPCRRQRRKGKPGAGAKTRRFRQSRFRQIVLHESGCLEAFPAPPTRATPQSQLRHCGTIIGVSSFLPTDGLHKARPLPLIRGGFNGYRADRRNQPSEGRSP